MFNLARAGRQVTYKRDIDDVREFPALDVILILNKRGARVTVDFEDPR